MFASGNQFEGEFRGGSRHGRGVFCFTSGAQYDGHWVKGLKHGFGKFTYPDGSFYCGDWKRNKKEGFGKYVYENGDIYEGTWLDDKKHGVGTYKYQLANISFKATWINGSLKGPIEIDYENFRYHGSWNGHNPVGEGVFSFGMKYMLPGHVERVFRPSSGQSASNESFRLFKMSSEMKSKVVKETRHSAKINDDGVQSEAGEVDGDCVPRFVAHEIEAYDYSKLPQQPFSLPKKDSDVTICTRSSQSESSEINRGSHEAEIICVEDSVEGKADDDDDFQGDSEVEEVTQEAIATEEVEEVTQEAFAVEEVQEDT